MRKQRDARQMLLVEHRREVRGDVVADRWGDPVDDDSERDAPFSGSPQVVPGNRVRIATGGRHEEPDVGSTEQLRGEFVVGRLHRVDVGRVEDRHATGQVVGNDQPEGAAVVTYVSNSPESWQWPRLVEPRHVLGPGCQHGRACGRPQHARFRHVAADERVGDRRLSRARRPPDDHQERHVESLQPGQQVVRQLAGEFTLHGGDTGGATQFEVQ